MNEATGFLEGQLSDDTAFSEFIKFAEEGRRDRQRRVDAGDESALIKFTKPAPAAPTNPPNGAPGGVKRPAPAGAPPGYGAPQKRMAPAPQQFAPLGGRGYGAPPPQRGPPQYGGGGYGAVGQRSPYGAPPMGHPAPGMYGAPPGGYYRR